MTRRMLALAAIALFLTISADAIVLNRAAAKPADEIEFNAVYNCGPGRSRFRVLSCKGTGKFDRCDIFYINELSPGGGFKDSINRSQIDTMLDQGCKTSGGASRTVTNANPTTVTQAPATKPGASVSCFASDSDSDVKNANEKNFRGVIRRLWEKEAAAGSDGGVTVTFQNIVVGAPRRWRATFDDAYSQADPRKPIYPVRATFTTCTDYRDAISKRKMERIFDCFTHKTGGWQCTQTGASGPLAMKDEKEYIPKKR